MLSNLNNLLSDTDNRRLQLVNILVRESEPIFISELAGKLEASTRVLKDDLAFFRNEIDDFIIESSQDGITLIFENNKGLKTISKKILENSIPYELLERIFLEEGKSVSQLAKELFVSSSTLYRIIKDVNTIIASREMKIETNPCRIVGSEQMIRYFAYHYFSEKYSLFSWPFKEFDEEIINQFLEILIHVTNNPSSYASLQTLKIIVVINLIRYKNGYYINTDHITEDFHEFDSYFANSKEIINKFEEHTGTEINNDFIKQVFSTYVQDSFFLNYEMFEKQAETNDIFAAEITFLDKFLTDLSKKYNIPLPNKEHVILMVHDDAYLEYDEPRSGYILYNQHGHFVKTIKEDFPSFYEDLYEGVSEYRRIIQAPPTEKGKNFLIYTIFTHWKYLITSLRKKYAKIQTLIISYRHMSHAYMLEDFLTYEYPTQLNIDVFSDLYLDKEILEESTHDLIVTNFPLPELTSKKIIYIQNIPTHKDLTKIQIAINEIISKRSKKI